jgi:hypothetical protein
MEKIEWDKRTIAGSEIETDISCIIGRARNPDNLRAICKYDVQNSYDKKQAEFKKETIKIIVKNESLTDFHRAIFSFGTSRFDKFQIYRVLEELFNKQIIMSDLSRPLKRMIEKELVFDALVPVNGIFPVIILNKTVDGFCYIVAPILERD